MYEYVHRSMDVLRGQKRQIPLDLKLYPVVNCLTWVQGTELSPSARAPHALNS